LPPSSNSDKTDKGLSGQFPNLVQTFLQILNVHHIDAPGFVRPFSVLVQIICTPLEHGNKLAHVYVLIYNEQSVTIGNYNEFNNSNIASSIKTEN